MACADSLQVAFEPAARSFSAPRTVSLARRIGHASQGAWRKYWRRRAERATLFILHSLDDRTLKDIGMDRSEIESVVYGACDRRICVSRSS